MLSLFTFSLTKLFLAIRLFLSSSRAFWKDFIAADFLLSMASAIPSLLRAGILSGVLWSISSLSCTAFGQSLATAALIAS